MGSVTYVRFSPDNRYVLWFEAGLNNAAGGGARSNGIRIWDMQEDRVLPHRIMAVVAWISFEFNGVENQIMVGGLEGGIETWNYVTGERIETFEGYEGAAQQLRISPDGRFLAFSNENNDYGVYDLKKQEVLFMAPPETSDVFGIAWSEDGNRLGVVRSNGQARVLNIPAIRSQLAKLGLDWE